MRARFAPEIPIPACCGAGDWPVGTELFAGLDMDIGGVDLPAGNVSFENFGLRQRGRKRQEGM
jgi:hypothetical protein